MLIFEHSGDRAGTARAARLSLHFAIWPVGLTVGPILVREHSMYFVLSLSTGLIGPRRRVGGRTNMAAVAGSNLALHQVYIIVPLIHEANHIGVRQGVAVANRTVATRRKAGQLAHKSLAEFFKSLHQCTRCAIQLGGVARKTQHAATRRQLLKPASTTPPYQWLKLKPCGLIPNCASTAVCAY